MSLSSSSKPVALESTYIPAVISSAKTLFSTVLGWQVEPRTEVKSTAFNPGRDISGIIGFGGVLQGIIVISFDQKVAFSAVEAFLGDMPTEITGDVYDTVGELANMIGGGVKDFMGFDEIALGMPTTVSGAGHVISFDTGAEIERVTLETPAGLVSIQIAVRRG